MNIYEATETDFNHNGLGFLKDVTYALVTEELNGEYNLYFEYILDGLLNEYLVNENIVKCKVADGSKQLFIIKNVEKDFGLIKVNCKHIFYKLLDNFVEDVSPSNLACSSFLQWVLNRTNYTNNFIAYSDISNNASARYVRKNPVQIILGDEDNSLVNLFGGELRRDNFDIHLNSRVGTDNGVKLRIGKNITGITFTTNTDSVYTRIMPVGFDGLLLPEKYVDSQLINNYTKPKICKVEFLNIKYDADDENAYHTLNEAYNALRKAANDLYIQGVDKPSINVKVDWIELSKTNEYKNYSNLEKVELGDTVYINMLNMEFVTRVIKVSYNPLTNTIDNFELGNPKANIGTSSNNLVKKIESIQPTSILESAKNRATKMLVDALRGYVYKTQNELFIMDTNDINTARKIWRWNLNGLGYSSNGIDGPYTTAITQNGEIVADFITTGKLISSVITDCVINAINLSTEGITINTSKLATILADKIKLEGYTSINGALIIDLLGNLHMKGGDILLQDTGSDSDPKIEIYDSSAVGESLVQKDMDLSGQTLRFIWATSGETDIIDPNSNITVLTSSGGYTIQGGYFYGALNSESYTLYKNGNRVASLYDAYLENPGQTHEMVTYRNPSSYTLPADFGTITSVNTTCGIYQYILAPVVVRNKTTTFKSSGIQIYDRLNNINTSYGSHGISIRDSYGNKSFSAEGIHYNTNYGRDYVEFDITKELFLYYVRGGRSQIKFDCMNTYETDDMFTIQIAGNEKLRVSNNGVYYSSISALSLAKLKKNFERLSSDKGLDIVLNTDVYKYHLKSQADSEKKHIGFVIGKKYKCSNDIINNANDGIDTYSAIAAAYGAIQKQQEQIESLQDGMKRLKEENKLFKEEIKKLKEMVGVK